MLRISDITGLFFVFSNLRTEPVAMFHLKNLREKRERARGCKDLPYSLYLEPATALFFMQADSRRCLRINNGRRFMHTELHLHRTSGTCDTVQGLSPMSDVLLSYGLKGDVGASPIQATRRRSLERNGKSFHRLMCIYMCRSRDTWPRRMNSISIKVINIKLDFLY